MWEPPLTSTVKGSIRTYPELKKDTAANGNQTAGSYCWTLVQETPTEEYKR
jgi:hypothetical protein